MTAALDVKGLSKTFGANRALDNAALSIQPGEIRALVGQNGCGKSTLIKILAGYHEPDPNGSVDVAGKPLAFGGAWSEAAEGLRFVHQDLGLVGDLNAIDNIALGKGYQTNRLGMIAWRSEAIATHALLSELGYDIDVRRPVSQLAISERTAVAIARAMSDGESTRVFVLDEPTANLPNAEAERLYELVRRLASRGIAILFVSHHFDEVFELAESVTVMRDGKIIDTRMVADITEPELIELVIGRKIGEHTLESSSHDSGRVTVAAYNLSGALVSNLSLEVREGEVVGVAGITGSGREEIIDLIFGNPRRRGDVLIEGERLPAGRPDLSVAAGVAMVPAERLVNAAFIDFPVRENVTVVNTKSNVINGFLSKSREASDVKYWLGKLDVRPPESELPMGNLSGGNQQKVVLARWLRQEPRVILLDEPTQGVDVGAKRDIHALIDEVVAQGTSVLVASTDHEELVRLCHRVLIIREGKIVDELCAPGIDNDHITALTIGRAE